MPDLHALLADEAEHLTPDAAPPFSDVQQRARRRSRARATGGLFGVLVVALVSVLVVVAVARPEPVPVSAPMDQTSFDDGRLSFRYPSVWTPFTYEVMHSGWVVFLSTEEIPDPCVTGPPAVTTLCRLPNPALSSGGVFVAWTVQGGYPPAHAVAVAPADATELISGRPARIVVGVPDGRCPAPGVDRQLVAEVWGIEPASTSAVLTMRACLAAPYEQTERQVLDMLDSVVITP